PTAARATRAASTQKSITRVPVDLSRLGFIDLSWRPFVVAVCQRASLQQSWPCDSLQDLRVYCRCFYICRGLRTTAAHLRSLRCDRGAANSRKPGHVNNSDCLFCYQSRPGKRLENYRGSFRDWRVGAEYSAALESVAPGRAVHWSQRN